MSTYCFISVMGTQVMGTINPLLALLADGFSISRVHLLVSDDVLEVGTHFEEFCTSLGITTEIELVSMPPYPDGIAPLAKDAAFATAQAATERGEQVIFNINGSTNQMLTQCCLALAPFKPLWVQATQRRVLLDDNGKLRQCRPAERLKAQDILDLQGAEAQSFEPHAEDFSVLSFCQSERISLPPHALVHKNIGGISFDILWTETNNRLSFLVNCLQKTLPQEGASRLAHERSIARWAANKDKNGHLFDRTVYALVDNDNTAEHLRTESNDKIRTVDCKGYGHDKRVLIRELKGLFEGQAMLPVQDIQAKKRKALELEEGTLVVALGFFPSATLLAIESHKPRHVALCHTENLLQQATNLREQCEALGVENVRLVPCDFEGSILPACFAVPQNPEKVFVNISPGTKGQGAYLALWAQKAGCAVWAVQPQTQTMERLDGKAEPIPLIAPDPLMLFQVRGERMHCDVKAQKDYTERDTALLAFLRTALGHEREEDVFRTSVKIDDVVMHRPAKKDWELRLADGTIYPFSLEGGEWLELLAAQAFTDAGAHISHARVRNLGSEEREQAILKRRGEDAKTHLMDMDVLGSYGGGHFLVSCKSHPKISIEKTVEEAHNMAKAVDRFTIALVCHLGCHKAYYDEKYGVMVFGWRELCQPEILRGYLQDLRAKFDSYYAKS